MSLFKKRLSLICLISALAASCISPAVTCSAYAEEAVSEQNTEVKAVQTFTIEDAVNYAKEHSTSLAAAKASEAYAKSSANEARVNKSKLKDNKNLTVTDISPILVTSGYAYDAALANYRIAQRTVLQTEYTLESNVSILFYTYLSNAEKVTIAKNSLSSAQEITKASEIKYSNGFISDIDMEQTRIAEEEALSALNKAEMDLELSMLNLKSGISYPLDQPLQITGSFTPPTKEETSYEAALARAEKSISRANNEDSFKVAQQKKKVYQGYYTSNQPAWHSAEAEYISAELKYNNALNDERINLYSAWSSVQATSERINTARKYLELAQKRVDAAKLSYSLGSMSTKEYLDSVRELYSTKNSLLDGELGLYSVNEQYRMLFDCENTIFEEDTVK